MLIELVEHDLRDGVALELDHDAHAVAVGLVAQVADALDLLVAHELGDASSISSALFTWYGISVTTICSRSSLPGDLLDARCARA